MSRPRSTWLVATSLLAALLSTACGPRAVRLPEGPGDPFPAYQDAFTAATSSCRDVRSLTAELAVSGAVGSNKVRGRVLAGFSTPERMRLEAVAPFGPPVFILAADGAEAVLVLPRGGQVLSGVPAPQILEAIIGVSARPSELQAVLDGCVVPDARAQAGHSYPNGWVRVDLEGGSAAYLRSQDGTWVMRAARTPLWAVEYERGTDRLPTEVRIRSAADGGPGSNLRLTLSQVDVNVAVDPAAFRVRPPRNATPITLDDLRRSGPLGEGR